MVYKAKNEVCNTFESSVEYMPQTSKQIMQSFAKCIVKNAAQIHAENVEHHCMGRQNFGLQVLTIHVLRA